jgi:hypothetical protein
MESLQEIEKATGDFELQRRVFFAAEKQIQKIFFDMEKYTEKLKELELCKETMYKDLTKFYLRDAITAGDVESLNPVTEEVINFCSVESVSTELRLKMVLFGSLQVIEYNLQIEELKESFSFTRKNCYSFFLDLKVPPSPLCG